MESNILLGLSGILLVYFLLVPSRKVTDTKVTSPKTPAALITQAPKKRKKKPKSKIIHQEENPIISHADVNKSDSEPESAHPSVLILKNAEMHAVDQSDEWIQPSSIIYKNLNSLYQK